MKMNFIKKTLTLFALGAIILSCDEDQQVGDSQMTPASPTISIALDFSNPTLIEDDSEHTYTVSLSEAQIVDVKLHVSQIGGTAGTDDYEMTGLVTIPAGYLSATGSITILSDDLIEDTETLQVQIGGVETANAALSPVTTEFTILNYTDGDLVVDLSWAMSIATDDAGEEISATDFADMRLLLTDAPNNTDILESADGGSFETYVLSGAPDGEYYLVADFYAANTDIVRDLDLNLEFNQAGIINGLSFDYPAAISNLGTCELNYFVMTKVIKSGDNYTFEDVSTQSYELTEDVIWSGDDATYASQVSTLAICDGIFITDLNAEWMLDWWGEIIIESEPVFASIDADGNVTIDSEYLCTTTYNGEEQTPYNVSGTGTYDVMTGALYIEYTLIQGTTDIGQYIFDQGWWGPNPYFIADLTVAP